MSSSSTSLFNIDALIPPPCAARKECRTPATIESLEDRALFSVAPAVGAAQLHHISAVVQNLSHNHHPHLKHSIVPIRITSVTNQAGQLVASGFIGTNPFTAPITLAVDQVATKAATTAQPAATTPVLDLQLGPINLNLLGLNVMTSPICAKITATSGPGNLLGNLLTDVANLLNGGTSLGSILGGLTGTQLGQLLSGITGILNGILGNLTAPTSLGTATGMATAAASTTCNILHLSLGPISLNLLGLNVNVDNCSGGPVTLDVTATQGQGNLLGNLLCGVANALNGTNLGQAAIDQILARIVGNVLRLV